VIYGKKQEKTTKDTNLLPFFSLKSNSLTNYRTSRFLEDFAEICDFIHEDNFN
jgi:hypothetical protein